MFSKGLFKLVGIGITIAIALLIGSNIITSIIAIVSEAKAGNPFPLILIYISTVVIVVISRFFDDKAITGVLLRISSLIAISYSGILSFVIGIPYGIAISLTFFALTTLFFAALYDPSEIRSFLNSDEYLSQLSKIRKWTTGDSYQSAGISTTLLNLHRVLLISQDDRSKVISLLKSRPYLPISLHHFVDCDVVILSINPEETNQTCRIIALFKELQIDSAKEAPNLMAEAILSIPLLDEQNGIIKSDYRVVKSESSVQNLLETFPIRMIVIGHPEGLQVLLPEHEILGVDSQPLPAGHENEILLMHNFQSIREVSKNANIT
ncbi:MAG: hypothetical protein GF411_12275 [Candidatus Lokiarchaeota archaeon]|nr:hypothetical protein [Candidatus Lokiarchaeota archaeon]